MLAALALLLTSGAPAADEAAARKEIDACFGRMAKAFGAKDLKTLSSYMAPDYTQVNTRGRRMSRQQSLAGLKRMMDGMRSLAAAYRIRSVTLHGREAVVRFRYRYSGSTKPDRSGKKRHIIARIPMRAIWVRSGKSWKMRRAEELEGSSLTVDGHTREH
jgi:ketosteroid isomerase-like protein